MVDNLSVDRSSGKVFATGHGHLGSFLKYAENPTIKSPR
jgi:hypothetical protein